MSRHAFGMAPLAVLALATAAGQGMLASTTAHAAAPQASQQQLAPDLARDLQRSLNQKGYGAGAVDGVVGESTPGPRSRNSSATATSPPRGGSTGGLSLPWKLAGSPRLANCRSGRRDLADSAMPINSRRGQHGHPPQPIHKLSLRFGPQRRVRSKPEARAGHVQRKNRGRQPVRRPHARDGANAHLLLRARGCPHGLVGADRPPHPLSLSGRCDLPNLKAGEPAGGECGMEL